jgi:cytochrome c oxidase subunit 2
MHSFFGPASPQASAVAHLWWWMFGVGGAVWLAVIATLFYVIRAKRGQRESDDLLHLTPERESRLTRVVSAAVFVTILILVGFLAFDFGVGRVVAQHPRSALTIEVTAHQWWWEAQYADTNPSKRLVTANEIHVPTGTPVQIKLASRDVIHSFWLPNLNGKRDLIPGYSSALWFTADTAGTYRGQCAEFCGLQHAKMAFYVVAEPPEKFAAWRAASSAPHSQPTDSTLLSGQRIFMSGGCAVCHTIAGTDARSTIGPDLSHFKSRATLAAGTLPNTRANLTDWIINPHAIKPGTRMPPSTLTSAQLNTLVAYLETLK